MKVQVVTVVAFWMAWLARGEDYVHEPVQYQNQPKEDGTYSFGYDTGLFGAHSLHYQYRDENGVVHGRYAYTDPSGNLRSVEYTAGPGGFRVKGDNGPEVRLQAEATDKISPSEDDILASADTRFESSKHFHPNQELKGTPYRRENVAHVHMENMGRPMVMLPKDPIFLNARLEDKFIINGDILRKPRPMPYKRPLLDMHPNTEVKGSPVLVHRDVKSYSDIHHHSDNKGIPETINLKRRVPIANIHPNSDIKGGSVTIYPERKLPHVNIPLKTNFKGTPALINPKGRIPNVNIHPNVDIKVIPVSIASEGRHTVDVYPNADLKGFPVSVTSKGKSHIDTPPNADIKGTSAFIAPKRTPLKTKSHIYFHPNAEIKGSPIASSVKIKPHVDIHQHSDIKGTPIIVSPPVIHSNVEIKNVPVMISPKNRPPIDSHPNADIKGSQVIISPKRRPHLDVHPNEDLKGTPVAIIAKGRPHISDHPNIDVKGTPILIPPKGVSHIDDFPPAIIVKGVSRHHADHRDLTIKEKHVHIPEQPIVEHATKGITEVRSHVEVHRDQATRKKPIVSVIQKKHNHDRSEITVEEELIHPGGIKGSRLVVPPPHLVKSTQENNAMHTAINHRQPKAERMQDRFLARQITTSSDGKDPRLHIHSDVNVHRDVQVLSNPGKVLPSRNGSHVHVHFDSKTNKTVVHIHRDPPTRGPHVHVHRDPINHELYYHQHDDLDPLRPHFHNESTHPEHTDHSPEAHVHQHRDPTDNHTYLHLHGNEAGHMHVHPDARNRMVEHIGNLVVTTVRDASGRMVSRHIHPAGELAHRHGHYQPDHSEEYTPDFEQKVKRMDSEERLERALHRTAHSDYRHHQGRYVYAVSLRDGRLAARRLSQDDDEPADHLVA